MHEKAEPLSPEMLIKEHIEWDITANKPFQHFV